MDDLSGKVFGRLTAIKPTKKNSKRNWVWLAICSCGNEVMVPGAYLTNGHTKSCGCLKKEIAAQGIKERSLTHGKSKTRIYKIWEAMRRRCNTTTCPDYKWYGGKGIRVCEEWVKFKPFQDWSLSNGDQDGLTIDRIDSGRGYSPDNCQWVSNEENVKRARYEKIHGKASADRIEILQVFDAKTGEDVTEKYR